MPDYMDSYGSGSPGMGNENIPVVTGRIHSLESCGTVDGPGIRFVVFLQGCPLRCCYCHNVDTWDKEGTSSTLIYTPGRLMQEILKYKSYMHYSGGGMTFTGGEPLLQSKFVEEVFSLCRKQGIHSALDTSGFLFQERTKSAIRLADLVLLDIKSFDETVYHTVTQGQLAPTLACLDYLRDHNIPTWIRYVLVPGLTDNPGHISNLAVYLKNYPNVERIELLPFHKMGEFKWEGLGQSYTLKETAEPGAEAMQYAKKLLAASGIPIF